MTTTYRIPAQLGRNCANNDLGRTICVWPAVSSDGEPGVTLSLVDGMIISTFCGDNLADLLDAIRHQHAEARRMVICVVK